jgi:hypothetical protein
MVISAILATVAMVSILSRSFLWRKNRILETFLNLCCEQFFDSNINKCFLNAIFCAKGDNLRIKIDNIYNAAQRCFIGDCGYL